MISPFSFQVKTRIAFGKGARHSVESHLPDGVRSVLVVTDPGLDETGLVAEIIGSFSSQLSVTVFAEVSENPDESVVAGAVEALRAAEADAVLAVGGGSSIDTAKATAVIGKYGGTFADYVGREQVPGPVLPVVALPTTAGTASEVTGVAVITSQAKKLKQVAWSPYLHPRTAVLDPEVLRTLPEKVAAATGMDALTHAIEAFVSLGATPLTDNLALQAIELIGANIRPFVANPISTQAEHMLLGSTVAGLAFMHANLGAVHAMSHPLSCHYGLGHGIANAVLLPYVLDFNVIACPEKVARLAAALGEICSEPATTARAESAVQAVRRLNADLGVPPSLGEIGVHDAHIDAMVSDALKSGPYRFNPRRMTGDQIKGVYQRAITGRPMERD